MPKEKLTKSDVKEILRLIQTGASNKDVCYVIGVAESTFYRWLKEPKTENQRELCKSIKKAEVSRKLWHINQINRAAEEGTWQASAWYLERRYPQEFAKPQRFMEDPRAKDSDNSIKAFIDALGLK